jgi:hypothetical protein
MFKGHERQLEIVRFVREGLKKSPRKRVSSSTVDNLSALCGRLPAIDAHEDFILETLRDRPDTPLDEMVERLAAERAQPPLPLLPGAADVTLGKEPAVKTAPEIKLKVPAFNMVRRTRSISGGRAQVKYLVRGMAAPVSSVFLGASTDGGRQRIASIAAVRCFLCRVSAALQRPARARHLDRRIGSSLNLQPAKAKRLRKTIDCRPGRPSGGTKAGSWGLCGQRSGFGP